MENIKRRLHECKLLATGLCFWIKKSTKGYKPWYICGGPSGTRTLDTLIKSQVLCQLS